MPLQPLCALAHSNATPAASRAAALALHDSPNRMHAEGGSAAPFSLRVGCALLLTLLAGTALAQAGGDFLLRRSVLGGGAVMQGGGFRVEATLAQVDAAPSAHGGSFGVAGGYWPQATAPTAGDAIFANGFEP